MGLFSFFTSRKDKPKLPSGTLIMDLVSFEVGGSRLGAPVAATDFFAGSFDTSGDYKNESIGLELGTKDGVLDYVCLTLADFSGELLSDGVLIEQLPKKEDQVVKRFGEPYWKDRSDGQTILFYEYEAGTIELQFEFSEAQQLETIALMRNGVLSDEQQRKSYGVVKPWPPQGA